MRRGFSGNGKAMVAALAALSVAACATEPEPCTAEWVAFKRDQILGEFLQQHGSEVGALIELKDTFETSGNGAASGASNAARMIRLAALAPKVARLVEDFGEVAAPEVNRAVARCGGAARTSQLFADMLRMEGVDEKTLEWVTTVGALVEGWNEAPQ